MALNVNIIGKDSEGNLQALKVNSEGNLEISDSLGWGELLQDISDKTGILALIKSELDNIKANQLSGDQKVTLSGKSALLKEYLNHDGAIGSDANAYGAQYTASGNSQLWVPLDVSDYDEIMIKVTNGYDVELRGLSFYNFKGHSKVGTGIFEQFLKEATLAVGATKIWKKQDLPALGGPLVGLVVYHYNSLRPTAGSISIEIMGG